MTLRAYCPEDESAVLDLWQLCGLISPDSRSVAQADIERKRHMQPERFLVGTLDDELIATAMAGYDGHRGHLYYVAVHPDHRHQGHGRRIVTRAAELLRELGCARVTLYVGNDNLAVMGFYERLGFERNDVVSMGCNVARL
jgi:ribosomal protein S18 acetylase RimI-like enzyme